MLNCSGDDGQKSHHLLTNRLSGKMSFLILRSFSACALRGVLLCRWTPLLSFISFFLVAASSVKAISLCFCMPKLPQNTNPFSPQCVTYVFPSPLNTSTTADVRKWHTLYVQGKAQLNVRLPSC